MANVESTLLYAAEKLQNSAASSCSMFAAMQQISYICLAGNFPAAL